MFCALGVGSLILRHMVISGWRLCRRVFTGKVAWLLFFTVFFAWVVYDKQAECFLGSGSLSRVDRNGTRLGARMFWCEVVGWMVCRGVFGLLKLSFSLISVRASRVKDPTHPQGGSLVRGTLPLDPNPDGPVLGPGGEGELSKMGGPLYAMSPMQAETPSSPQEPLSTTTQVSSNFRPGERLDSEPLSRNGSLAENIIQESVFWKMPQADGDRLPQVEACEFPMRQAVKGKAHIVALSGDPVNPPEGCQKGDKTAAVAGDGVPPPGRRPRAIVTQTI